MNPIYIGLSGYSYKPWQGKGRFYPEKLKSAEFLRYYASRFNTVELDGMWYRLPTEQTMQGWLEQTPASFIFSPKAHRQITHMHRLQPDALIFVKTMLDRLAPLIRQKRLGPILLQLPPNFTRDDDRLNKFLEQASRIVRWAIEFRQRGWVGPKLLELLRRHRVALALVESRWVRREEMIDLTIHPTTDFAYVRWMGTGTRIEDFSTVQVNRDRELSVWAMALAALAARVPAVYGYFSNHFQGHAPASAREMQRLIGGSPVEPEKLRSQTTLF